MGCCTSKQTADTFRDGVSTEPKPATNAASPKTKISGESDEQGSLVARTDSTVVEAPGQGSAETAPIQHPPDPSTDKPWRSSYPPQTPSRAPALLTPPVQSRLENGSTRPDESPKSHRQRLGVKRSASDMKSPFKIHELQGLLPAGGERSERLKALDRTGQLTERTKPKFKGGFSDVSKAKLGDRVVAVKALRSTNVESEEETVQMSKRLAREIYVWAALDHPNVLGLLGFAFEDGIPCLISPWCDNGSLQTYLQKSPYANRRRLVREIAEGLRYLHKQTPPIIHGDLKTTNVLVTDQHSAKICDFGTSKRIEQLSTGFTTSDTVCNTTRYSAPEILRDGQHPTLSSDVFSFACVALETMTDKYPFWKIPKDAGVITQVVFQKQMPSPEDHPRMEDVMWELLRRCWNYDPSGRPDITDVCQTLSRAGYGYSTANHPPTPRVRSAKPAESV